MSMTISFTWAGQCTDQIFSHDRHDTSVCMSVVYNYQVTDMDGRGVCGVVRSLSIWMVNRSFSTRL